MSDNKLHLHEMMMFALYWTNKSSWIFIEVDLRNNNPLVDMSLHTNILSWFWANQPLLFLLIAAVYVDQPIRSAIQINKY